MTLFSGEIIGRWSVVTWYGGVTGDIRWRVCVMTAWLCVVIWYGGEPAHHASLDINERKVMANGQQWR